MILPPYEQHPTISNQTITLREIRATDVKELIEISFYDAVQATSVEQAAEMQEKINLDYINGNSIHWGIVDNKTNSIVGTCGYYRGLDKGEGELGCVLLSKYRGKGYMSAALLLAIEFGLQTIGLRRIWAATTTDNHKAIRLFENIGFVKIGYLNEGEVEYELKFIKEC